MSKSIFKSKTAVVAFLTAAASLWPPAQEFVAANPQAVLLGVGVVGLGLRLITKDKVKLFPDSE